MIRYLRALWRNFHHRDELNEDLNEELGAYFDAIVADKISYGVDREALYARPVGNWVEWNR